MSYNRKNGDITVWGARLLLLFCVAGMFYLPYQSGKKFFQKYPTQAAKIKGFLLALIYAPLGFFIDLLIFNIVLAETGGKALAREHLYDPLGIGIFCTLFLGGVIVGFIGKKYDKPTT